MAKLKKDDGPFAEGWLNRQMKAIEERRGPVRGQRWWVSEVTPAYETMGYYSETIPQSEKRVSEVFYKKEEATAWLEKYEPDKGNHFVVRSETLHHVTNKEWHPAQP